MSIETLVACFSAVSVSNAEAKAVYRASVDTVVAAMLDTA